MVRFGRDVSQLLGLRSAAQQCMTEERAADNARLSRALVDEFYRTALSVVTMTSLANALTGRHQVQLFGSIKAYMPPEATLYPVVKRGLVMSAIDHELMADLHAFYQEVQVATVQTNLDVERVKPIRLALSVEWKKLSWEWQAACGAGRKVLATISTAVEMDPVLTNRLEFLSDIAKAAEDGGIPCVAFDGVVIVPGIMDRRATERVRVGAPVWLESNAGLQRVTLQDISEGGMGLACCRALKMGMPIVVQLGCGRRLAGIAVWVRGDRAGVTFATPLLPGDPLLVPGNDFR